MHDHTYEVDGSMSLADDKMWSTYNVIH